MKQSDPVKKIIVVTDKFRSSLTAGEAAEAVRKGIPQGEVLTFPMADGGEGSLETMERALQQTGRPYQKINIESVDHIGRPKQVPVLLFTEKSPEGKPSAFVEMASVCGLNLVPRKERDLLHSTTYGLGEVLRVLIEEKGIRRILLAIGGSGTDDGGFGMLTALGFRYRNTSVFRNRDIAAFIGCIEEIKDGAVPTVTPHLYETEILVACDVENPLTGPEGATRIYGPQKGGDPETLDRLEEALQNWGSVIEAWKGKPGASLHPGAGAAGGIGFALETVLGARLVPGWQLFNGLLRLEEHISACDLVITGEGKFDRQSLSGKLVSGICRISAQYGKPVLLVTGRCEIAPEERRKMGILHLIELSSAARPGESSFTDAAGILTREISRYMKEQA